MPISSGLRAFEDDKLLVRPCNFTGESLIQIGDYNLDFTFKNIRQDLASVGCER